jgi:hypothetical protein
MIRWGAFLMAAVLLPGVARADSATTKAQLAFAAICAAAIDERPDIVSIASSVGLDAAGGLKEVMTVGHTGLRAFTSAPTKQNIIVTINTFGDAREISCKSTIPAHTERAELEDLARKLKLDGGFFDVAGVTTGSWKRPGNQPLVFVTMNSTPMSTTLAMQRIDIAAPAPEKK